MSKWVAIWGSSPAIAAVVPASYGRDITLRYCLRSMLSGSRIRLHLNNLYGREDARITRMYAIKGDTAVPVTFGGQAACVLPAGAEAVSDEIPFALERGEEYAISFYLGDMTPLHCGTKDTGPLCRFFFAEGDHAAAPALPPAHSAPAETVYFLDTVDVLTEDEKAHALVCFGDSITSQAWPDYLALRVLRENKEQLSVIRRGISGSRVLREYAHLEHRHYGSRGQARFQREVGAAGADRVVILHGVNDIIHPCGTELRPWSDLPTAQQLIDGLRWYIRKGHEMGLKVYLATIVTIKGWITYLPQREELRQAINQWIRSQQEADGVVDFDAATRDPQDENARLPLYDSGDHLHPSLQGAERMAESVPGEYLE